MELNKDLQNLQVLIVDDEPFQRRVLREVLKNLDFRNITEADSGQTAIKKMTTQRFDVVLSDVQMPDMNGLELLRRIRAGNVPTPRDSRFIILTAFSNTEVLGAAMTLDVNGFLAKPIRIGVVMEKIKKAVQEKFSLRPEKDYEFVVTDLPTLDVTRRTVEPAPPSRPSAEDKMEVHAATILIPLTRLREGMRVAKDVVATDGAIIIPAGTKLTQLSLNRLSELSSLLTDNVLHILPP